ncbi:MAG: ABC transporter ATP-binding protein [Alphaproteobacteria bacterium]|nr:ABC transporter ATP-binding protein [Alphaproteobacteria bacterium]
MPELLAVEDLSLGFRTDAGLARVLDGVNLAIQPGQIMGLVGESGCGKTTLARAILGILPRHAARIEHGLIRFEGADLLSTDDATLNEGVRGKAITFIPQDPFTSFNPVFPIGTQMMEIMRWKSPRRAQDGGGNTRARRAADRDAVLAMLDAVQLPQPRQVLEKYPHEVSGGQRQRLMIAMALLPEPRLVIADEPTTALDVTIQAQILKLLRRLATERGVAVLLTTHDLGTAYEICDAITVMYAGQEVEAAPTDAFFRRPAHPYTARLLASLPRADGKVLGIPGEVPNLLAPPGGCRFHPRCDRAEPACSRSRPPVTLPGQGHAVRCYHPQA